MSKIEFTDEHGSFTMEDAQNISYLYFPVAGDGAEGVKSSLTPKLGGDSKIDQNTFLLEPVSAENLHANQGSRNFWCCFENGAWSATGMSAETESFRGTEWEEHTKLTAGFMWHKVCRASKKYALSSELLTFVPKEFPGTEVTLITIQNDGTDACSFRPMTAVPMYGRSADNIRDHRHVTSLLHRAVTVDCGIELTPALTFDERGHKKNTVTYYAYAAKEDKTLPAGSIPAVPDFIGEGGSFLHPAAAYGKVPYVTSGTKTDGCEIMAALVFEECTIAPGESVSFAMLCGIDRQNSRQEGKEALKNRTYHDWLQSFEHTKKDWQEQVNIAFHSGDSRFDSYMKWITFQPILRRIYGCSFLPHHDYGKGGRGWRDLWQDCLALLLMNPAGVRKQLLANFDGVRADGTNATIIGTKPGEFVADRNNITRVWMDHGFWPLHTMQFYIHQTGDLNILLEETKYFKDRQGARGTKKDDLWQETDGTCQKTEDGQVLYGTVFEHLLLQNLTACLDVGEHNRLLLRGADWNDALDMAAERGESVAFSFAYAGNLGVLSELTKKLAEQGISELSLAEEVAGLLSFDEVMMQDAKAKRALLNRYTEQVLHAVSGKKKTVSAAELSDNLKKLELCMKEQLRKEEWLTGKPGFFNGYYDNHGRAVERNACRDVRMMLTGQVFAVMSGTATTEQIKEVVQAADTWLYDGARGGYCLNTDFEEVKDDLGRMFGFAYGHKENGAVFSHMAVMYGNALYQRGFAEEGFRSLHSLYRQAEQISVSRIYPGIPEYFDDRGRGMYHYLTGAASWYLMTVLTQMYGIHGRYGDLCLEPKLLNSQFDENGQATAELVFADRKLRVIYKKDGSAECSRVTEVTAGGRKRSEACILREELLSWDAAQVHEIEVKLSE